MRRTITYLSCLCLSFTSSVITCEALSYQVELIQFQTTEVSRPSQHGLNKLVGVIEMAGGHVGKPVKAVMDDADYYIFAGLSSETSKLTPLIGKELGEFSLPVGKESLLIQKTTYKDKPALFLCGGDEVGLMYAALDVAERISWSNNQEDPFEFVVNAFEAPDVKERTVSTGTFHRKYFEQRLHDIKYWEQYFDMMAENRLNQFLLIFGYKNNQMRVPNFVAPVYPNFFDVEEFPLVKLSNVTKDQQEKNTQALKAIIKLAHDRGIEFGVGLWDQIERDGRFHSLVKDDEEIPEDFPADIIWGLSKENLIPYTNIAMRKFFQTFPDIDMVQFRMHWESGIKGDVALKFWKEIFNMIKDECPDIKIEARAKDVPDETLYDGVATGADFRVVTKHWMEQMGQPFHPTHVNRDNQFDRRHGYADLLRYPQRYGFKWRVWSGGTTRVFQWGDPQWVRTFAEGSHLYDAIGYEFNEPLYFKMNGSDHAADVTPLLSEGHDYYTYEFERYWHYFQVMGRVGYNPETPTDIWEHEFAQRFGKEVGPWVMKGLHQASRVLPRIVTASYLYPRFASPQGWPELQRMENLKHYALKSRPSDIQQFASPQEEVRQILNGEFSVRRTPAQISEWFAATSASILDAVAQAEKLTGKGGSKEFVSTITDLKMLAHLAGYHSQRLLAGVQYGLYHETGDLVSFDLALDHESKAVDAYGRLVEAAGDVYNHQLDFGSNPDLFPGHWKHEHQRLVDELGQYREERKAAETTSKAGQDLVAHVPVQRILSEEKLLIKGTLRQGAENKEITVYYAREGEPYKGVKMEFAADSIGSVKIPHSSEEQVLNYYIAETSIAGVRESWPKNAFNSPYQVIVSTDREPPVAEVERVDTADLNKSVKVSAVVRDASEIERVSLRYRRVSQTEDYLSAKMTLNPTTGKYEATIPASFFEGKYDVMYFIEAMDSIGNGRMYPDMEVGTPYVVISLNR